MVFAVDIGSRSVEMSRAEAEEITLAIQQNFDSLGSMIEIAKNRKAWKALNYKDFSSYCNNEFGKSQRRAYELIAEAAAIQLLKEADPSLRLPAQSNLRLLKELPIEQQLEAIKRSESLAAESNKKKPNKSDLLTAIDEISSIRSGDMRASLEARGFIKGVEVATTRGVNVGSRGVVKKVDKKGRIHVELHSGGNVEIDFDAASLRILSANEKPEKRAWFGTTDIGDKVLIFSKGLENTLGTIKARLSNEKMVGVEVGGQTLKLPYAELEVVEVEVDEPEQEDSWLQNFIWADFGAQWCYDSESETITTVYQDLKLHPTEKGKGSPADWVRRWAKENIPNLAFDLLPLEQLSTLIKSRLITCGGEEEKGNLAESLITEIWKMTLPSECRKNVKALISDKADKARGISFGLVLPELLSGKKTQTRRAWQDDYAESFIRYYEEGIEIPALDKGRHRGGQEIGKIRLTEKPYQQILSEMPISDLEKEGGMCATVQEFTDRFFEGQDKLVWVLNFEFIVADSSAEIALLKQRLEEAEQVIDNLVKCQASVAISKAVKSVDTVYNNVGNTEIDNSPQQEQLTQLAQTKEVIDNVTVAASPLDCPQTPEFLLGNTDSAASPLDCPQTPEFLLGNTDSATSPLGAPETSGFSALKVELSRWRKKINEDIARNSKKLQGAKKTESVKLNKALDDSYSKLLELDIFENIKTGQTVEKKVAQGIYGRVTDLDFSRGGLPQVWVRWMESKYAESINVGALNLSPVISPPSSDLDPSLQEDINRARENLIAWRNHAETELAEAEEHNKSIFIRKIEDRNRKLEELEAFGNLRIGQYAVDKYSPRRGKVLWMGLFQAERLEVHMEWENGKTETIAFRDIVPEQMS